MAGFKTVQKAMATKKPASTAHKKSQRNNVGQHSRAESIEEDVIQEVVLVKQSPETLPTLAKQPAAKPSAQH